MNQQKTRLRGVATISDRPARIGKLKIGEVVQNAQGVKHPSKLDYIKAVDGAGAKVEAFHAVYGPKPTEFRAVFPSDDPVAFWWESYRKYGSGTGLVCHGNGAQAIVEATGESIECPCSCAEGDRPTCKPVGSLSLFLYDVPALGVFQIDTGSLNSIKNIRWFLAALPGLTGGQYKGIPFRVKVEPFQAMHDGKASTAYAWKMDLLPGMKPTDLRMAAQEAVESFLLPPSMASQPLLDEAKPEDLYTVIEAAADETPVVPLDAQAAADSLRAAIESADLPGGKKFTALALLEANLTQAAADNTWPAFATWCVTTEARVRG
jgi:hypothetical protein